MVKVFWDDEIQRTLKQIHQNITKQDGDEVSDPEGTFILQLAEFIQVGLAMVEEVSLINALKKVRHRAAELMFWLRRTANMDTSISKWYGREMVYKDMVFYAATGLGPEEIVKGGVRMMEIRWMNSDVNRPSGIDEGRRRR